MNTFKKLSEANVNHYNEHPLQHLAIAVAWGIGSTIVMRRAIRKLNLLDNNRAF